MRAVLVDQIGGPEVMTCQDIPAPVPGPREVLIQVEAAGVNFIDTYHRSGVYPRPRPCVLGMEGAGTICAVGPDVGQWHVGDRVAWPSVPGSYAEQLVAPADAIVAIPEGITTRIAAAAMLQGATVHYLVRSTFPVTHGHTVLVHAGAGGVGLLLTQWAKHLGARVITTVSTEEKAALSHNAGADAVIRYDREDVAARVRELTDGRGCDVVYDGVGAATFEASLASTAVRGTLVVFGGASGQVPPFDLQRLNLSGSLFLTRPSLGHYIATPEELRWRTSEICHAITAGWLSVRIGAEYALEDAAEAHHALEGRHTTGKVLLIP